MQAMFPASLRTTTTWAAQLLSRPARFSIPRPLTSQQTHSALQDSTRLWSLSLMPSSMLLHAGLASRQWLELLQTINQLTTARQPSVQATSALRTLPSRTGEAVMHLCSLMPHRHSPRWQLISSPPATKKWHSQRWQVTSSPPATPATASTGTALHGPPKRTNTRTRSALCTDWDSIRTNRSTSQHFGTMMADCV